MEPQEPTDEEQQQYLAIFNNAEDSEEAILEKLEQLPEHVRKYFDQLWQALPARVDGRED